MWIPAYQIDWIFSTSQGNLRYIKILRPSLVWLGNTNQDEVTLVEISCFGRNSLNSGNWQIFSFKACSNLCNWDKWNQTHVRHFSFSLLNRAVFCLCGFIYVGIYYVSIETKCKWTHVTNLAFNQLNWAVLCFYCFIYVAIYHIAIEAKCKSTHMAYLELLAKPDYCFFVQVVSILLIFWI